MNLKDELQIQSIQLDMINPKEDPDSLIQLIEWAKQVSAKQKELQRQIDNLNRWVFPQ